MTTPFLNSYGNPFNESRPSRIVDQRRKGNDPATLEPVNVEHTEKVEPYELGEFLAWVRSAGLQKTNRFFVTMDIPVSLQKGSTSRTSAMKKDILLACEEINIPPRTIQTRTLRLAGLNEKRASTIDYGGDLTLTFLVDNTHEIQDFFERWMNMEVDQTTREVGQYFDYITTVDLWFLRPFSPNETYNALSRYESGTNRFISAARDRLVNLAASEVGRFKNKLRGALESKKREIINSNIGLYTRLKSVLPLEMLSQKSDSPSDFAMYKISFKEAFPTQITRSVMNQGGTDVMRITVQFSFKEYTTKASGLQKSTPDDNKIFNFIKRIGIPTTKSGIVRSITNFL